MPQRDENVLSILPREKWWWLGLALLLILAGWLYLRGYNVSLPYIDHVDEPQHLLAAQHIIDDGSARSISRSFSSGYEPAQLSVSKAYKTRKRASCHNAAYSAAIDNFGVDVGDPNNRITRPFDCSTLNRFDGGRDLGCQSLGCPKSAFRPARRLSNPFHPSQSLAGAHRLTL